MRTALLVTILIAASGGVAAASAKDPFAAWHGMTAKASSSYDKNHGPEQAFRAGYGEGAGWCAKKGDGIGETLHLELAQPIALASITIRAGNFAGALTPSKKWNRIAALTVAIDGGAAQTVAPKDAGEGVFQVELGAKPVHAIEIGFAKVIKGKTRASCIGEVIFSTGGDDDDRVVLVSDAKATDALDGNAKAIAAALAGCDAGKLDAAISFPFKVTIGAPHQGLKSGPRKSDKATTYKSSAALVKAGCKLPPLPGSGDAFDRNPSPLDSCQREGVDELDCSNTLDGDQWWWRVRWTSGAWKLVEAIRLPGEDSASDED